MNLNLINEWLQKRFNWPESDYLKDPGSGMSLVRFVMYSDCLKSEHSEWYGGERHVFTKYNMFHPEKPEYIVKLELEHRDVKHGYIYLDNNYLEVSIERSAVTEPLFLHCALMLMMSYCNDFYEEAHMFGEPLEDFLKRIFL